MERKSDDFSIRDAMRLANSPAGQQLFHLLQAQDPDAMSKAMADASSGDYGKVKQTLSAMLDSPQIRQLMERLKEDSNG
ncbi:MAG: hypothetical protein E7466_00075 [Ruminococcaceae bacterium]|nr:hypothetical protein [Oscillospiraceae bacterium]MBQ3214850.1 hypothetical protein [Oscillospiraceae bacterium]